MEDDDIAAEIVVQYLEEIECARHVGRGDLKGEIVNLAITNSPYKTTEICTQRPHCRIEISGRARKAVEALRTDQKHYESMELRRWLNTDDLSKSMVHGARCVVILVRRFTST